MMQLAQLKSKSSLLIIYHKFGEKNLKNREIFKQIFSSNFSSEKIEIFPHSNMMRFWSDVLVPAE